MLSCLAAGAARGARPPLWVEMVEGGAEARLVTDEQACPTLQVDGRLLKMTERAEIETDFPNRVCEARLPDRAQRASIQGHPLPSPRARPRRLVILGDSGCRLKTGAPVQDCNSPSGWPLERIANLAAAQKPDLVIHVGDYYYRETACRPGDEGRCGDSPFGDKWPTWKAELFDPASQLLEAAPWVFVRGNHEDCRRGGPGWFRMLDASPQPRTCPASSKTFDVDIGGVRLAVVDSADTVDGAAPPDKVQAFARSLAGVLDQPGSPSTWIVTHRPIWNIRRVGDAISESDVNETQRAAVRNHDLGAVQMVVSGHVHNFTSLQFGPARPAQLIVGTGGDAMDPNDLPPPATGKVAVDGMDAQAFTMGRWGYFLLDRKGADWAGSFRDLNDRIVARCRLHARTLVCRAAN
jgi:hypothetical protein